MTKSIITTVIVFFFSFVPTVYGHAADMPPYLKINDEFTKVYQVPFPSVDEEALFLPQDIGAKSYIVNEQIRFSLEAAQLPLAPEMIETARFSWEFGDGNVSEGLVVEHMYTKPGSYMQMLHVKTPQSQEPQLLQSTLLHILPKEGYTLPKAVISINNVAITDPLVEIQTLSFKKPILFSAQKSISKGKIVEYIWDFGDEKTMKTKMPMIEHAYNEKDFPYGLPIVFPIVRVKDENGFISDTFAQINNGDTKDSRQNNMSTKKGLPLWPVAAILGFLMISTAGLYFYNLFKK